MCIVSDITNAQFLEDRAHKEDRIDVNGLIEKRVDGLPPLLYRLPHGSYNTKAAWEVGGDRHNQGPLPWQHPHALSGYNREMQSGLAGGKILTDWIRAFMPRTSDVFSLNGRRHLGGLFRGAASKHDVIKQLAKSTARKSQVETSVVDDGVKYHPNLRFSGRIRN